MKISHLIRTVLGTSLLLGALGLGNALLGQYKANQYIRLLSKAERELARGTPQKSLPLPLSGLNIDTETQYINRLKARVDFYRVVLIGGKCFLAVSGMLLAATLLLLRYRAEDPKKEVSLHGDAA